MKVVLLDDFHPLINETLLKWGFEVIDGRGFKSTDLLSVENLDGIFIRSSIPLNKSMLPDGTSRIIQQCCLHQGNEANNFYGSDGS